MKNRISYILLLLATLFSVSACDNSKDTPEEDTKVADLVIEVSEVSLQPGEVLEIPVKSGSGDYFASIPEIGIASAKISDTSISLTGIKEGETRIKITDNITSQSKVIKVTVASDPVVALSHRKLKIVTGATSLVTILSGSGDYTFSLSNQELGSYYFSDSNIVFTAKSIGSGTLTIADNVTGAKTELPIEVTLVPLILDAYEAMIAIGDVHKISIKSGSKDYSISSDQPEVAEATISMSTISIKALSLGEAVVTINDNATGASITIKVTTTLQPLVTSYDGKEDFNVIIGTPATLSIIKGNGSYTVESSDQSIFTVSIEGNIVTVHPLAKGDAILTIIDTISQEEFKIKVVSSDVPRLIIFSVDKVRVKVGRSVRVQILENNSGNEWPNYDTEDPSIARAYESWSQPVITIYGYKVGQTNLVASDWSGTVYAIIPIEVYE